MSKPSEEISFDSSCFVLPVSLLASCTGTWAWPLPFTHKLATYEMATNSSWHMGLAEALPSCLELAKSVGGMHGGMRQKEAAIHRIPVQGSLVCAS